METTEIKLYNNDCLIQLKELEDNSVDSIVTDPPYEISFMSKGWDGTGIAFNQEVWKECLRVLKPGGHLLAFGATRTYHRMTVAIEDSGFEIRDCLFWCYGSGFPKSHNIGKNVEKIKVGGKSNLKKIGTKKGLVATNHNDKAKSKSPSGFSYRTQHKGYSDVATDRTQTTGDIPVYEITNEWEGFGTALKPAVEPVVMGRKPFKGSVAQNVLEWGTGGINIDGCRIAFATDADKKESTQKNQHADFGTKPLTGNVIYGDYSMVQPKNYNPPGRFPANLILDEEAGKMMDEQSGNIKGGKSMPPFQGKPKNDINFTSGVKEINRIGYNDNGGASRFFYCPKVSKKERNEGLEHITPKSNGKIVANPNKPTEPQQNVHPTVKPIALLSYLIRLVTPKNGIVLDPFMGSGSTGKAAIVEGMRFIGIEKEEEYYDIAKARIEYEYDKRKFF
jgi:DNA modification methylase